MTLFTLLYQAAGADTTRLSWVGRSFHTDVANNQSRQQCEGGAWPANHGAAWLPARRLALLLARAPSLYTITKLKPT